MWKAISAIAVAAMMAGAISLLPGSDVSASAPTISAKNDRADLPQSCTQQGWPYYQTACLHDEARNAGRVLNVRVVSTDRIPQDDSNTRADLIPYWPVALAELQIATPLWARGTK
jgi:hypothetical protein